MTAAFELFLFSTEVATIQPAVAGGLTGVVVDWEHYGKAERQRGIDTQINHDTVYDLKRVRGAIPATVICRLNAFGHHTPLELEQAIAAGADEVLLPMVRAPEEVSALLELAQSRCGVGFLVETRDAVARIDEFADLAVSRVYVGLMDLWIERGSDNLFAPLMDGTLERVRRAVRAPFGFGGLTLPERGAPVPCRLLMAEMARLRCDFSFLRRSFLTDTRDRDLSAEVPRILQAMEDERAPSGAAPARHRNALLQRIGAWRSQLASP
jgi:2-keto-3-deoxy-L-rhamnonate aldolase RhmA